MNTKRRPSNLTIAARHMSRRPIESYPSHLSALTRNRVHSLDLSRPTLLCAAGCTCPTLRVCLRQSAGCRCILARRTRGVDWARCHAPLGGNLDAADSDMDVRSPHLTEFLRSPPRIPYIIKVQTYRPDWNRGWRHECDNKAVLPSPVRSLSLIGDLID